MERRLVFSKRAGSFVGKSSDFSIVISQSGYGTPNVARRRVGSSSFRQVLFILSGLIFGATGPVHGSTAAGSATDCWCEGDSIRPVSVFSTVTVSFMIRGGYLNEARTLK